MHSLGCTALLTLAVSMSLGAVIDTEGLPDTGLNTSSWVTGQAPPLDDIFNLHDIQLVAKNTLSKTSYAYYSNLNACKNIKLKPRAFRNVVNVTTEDLNFVKSAGKAGILYASSIASNKSTAEIGAAAANNQTLFRQLYPWSNTTRLQTDLKEIDPLSSPKPNLLAYYSEGNYGQQTAVEVLLDLRKNAPEVLDDGGMEIYVDGGVRHGTDVIKLLALGARAIGLGRSDEVARFDKARGDKLNGCLGVFVSGQRKQGEVATLRIFEAPKLSVREDETGSVSGSNRGSEPTLDERRADPTVREATDHVAKWNKPRPQVEMCDASKALKKIERER
ncbi:unnamed protein product [Rhizoctonia solani]|uniref:FMN-dependent dehydrogenase domain-containing protein n=1 Tax=Rhizoctonia solani TaxID=456999 RepID=A0A8H3BG16_9AGAM|nr:unnamed protein product [Rhizoctonia solani]